jgi:hypothetical protein
VAAYSQSDIDDLISCPKEISDPPKKEMKLNGAHWRNDAKLKASDGKTGEFSMFMRKNEDFPENFSIGLSYNPRDGRSEITLLRCNGKHGDFNKSFDPTHPHSDFHIHRAKETAIDEGLAPEKDAAKTDEFASFEWALQYFVRAVNLNPEDAHKYFPDRTQTSLLFKEYDHGHS